MKKTLRLSAHQAEKHLVKIDLFKASAPMGQHCQIQAKNDLEAVHSWLSSHESSKHTYLTYRREAERFLQWIIVEVGCALCDLKKEHLEEYWQFLKNPPEHWCSSKKIKWSKDSANWRPFCGPLSTSAINAAFRVLNSLFTYLVDADYLYKNPLQLFKRAKDEIMSESQGYAVWERMLERTEWEALQNTLNNWEECTPAKLYVKMQLQFLVAMLYLLGLRIQEVADSQWSYFKELEGQWWFFIQGKGNKPGHIPVNQQLQMYITYYRRFLGLSDLPAPGETTSLFISSKTGHALSVKSLYGYIKELGKRTAMTFSKDSRSAAKLQRFSPHWLRHLSASHQSRAGLGLTMIKANHRHRSSLTTQLYMHSENEARAQAMEEHRMNLEPVQRDIKPIVYVFEGSFSKGPLDKVKGVAIVLQTFEQERLNKYAYQKGEANTALAFKYTLVKISLNELAALQQELISLAAMWLFECRVEFTAVEEEHVTA